MHEESRAQLSRSQERSGPLEPPLRVLRCVSVTARVPNANIVAAMQCLYTFSFQTQGVLATDCDGSASHGKWQEPAGTLWWLLPRTIPPMERGSKGSVI